MYNEELKLRYIQEKSERIVVDKYYLPNVFKKTEVFEQLLNKDVSNFTVSEIEEMIKMCGFASYNMITTFVSAVSLYTNWCLNQGLVTDSQNHFLEIGKDNYGKLIDRTMYNMRIVNRKQIESWVMELPNPSDRFVFLGVFEGIKGREYCEYVKMVKDDINVSDSIVTLTATNRRLACSKLLCNIGLESADTYTYYPITGNMEREAKFIPSDKVIKDMVNIKDDKKSNVGRRVYFKLLRSIKYLGIDSFFDPNALQDSGIVDMIITRSDELNIDRKEYVYKYISEINERYGKNYLPYYIIRKLGDACLI